MTSVDTNVVRDMNAWIGYALWQSQALEHTLVQLILIDHAQLPSATAESRLKKQSILEKMTFGNILADLRSRPAIPAGLIVELERVVGERNWLALFSDNLGVIYSTARLNSLIQRLEALGDAALSLNKQFAGIVDSLILATGVSKEEYEHRAATLLASWQEG